jgi:hypothetical protein
MVVKSGVSWAHPRLVLLAGASILAVLALSAHAAPPAEPTGNLAGSGVEVQEIVVTAQKREETANTARTPSASTYRSRLGPSPCGLAGAVGGFSMTSAALGHPGLTDSNCPAEDEMTFVF